MNNFLCYSTKAPMLQNFATVSSTAPLLQLLFLSFSTSLVVTLKRQVTKSRSVSESPPQWQRNEGPVRAARLLFQVTTGGRRLQRHSARARMHIALELGSVAGLLGSWLRSLACGSSDVSRPLNTQRCNRQARGWWQGRKKGA